ncbi:MAG: PD-(D/E)XK nuclease family protein [Myxococcales bacterium]|nr:PD-(D/E)XK nuclease family protein [Myxococcales bacterium]
MSPSSVAADAGALGVPQSLGEAFAVPGAADADLLGDALHGFLAAEAPTLTRGARRDLAEGLLARHGVSGALDPERLLEMSDRLRAWLARVAPGARVLREWPLGSCDDLGTLVAGTADMLVEHNEQVMIIDHKSHRSVDGAKKNVLSLAGQLACYANAIKQLRPDAQISTWVHLPFAGVVVPVSAVGQV